MEQNKDNLGRQNGWKRAPFSEKTGMWVCPICGQIKPLDQPCARCGFDMRADFLNLRTVTPVPRADVDKWLTCVSADAAGNGQKQEPQNAQNREKTGDIQTGLKIWMAVLFIAIYIFLFASLPVMAMICMILEVLLIFFYFIGKKP